jgi:glycosyltransferase involved in cell wall biosynthesis
MTVKILQLVTRRQFRGAEVFAARLSEELIGQGVQIVFVGLYDPPVNPLSIAGARNTDLGVKNRGSFLSLTALKKLRTIIREEKPDVIQANGSDTLKYALAARALSGYRPVIYRNISMISNWMGKSALKKNLYSALFRMVDHVSSVGNESRKDFISFFQYPEEKISVIRRGVPFSAADRSSVRTALLTSLGLFPGSRIVVHVGNFSPEKNHAFLIDVFSVIRKEDPAVKLLLVGNGEEYTGIENAVKARSLSDTVFLLGFRSDMENILPAADLFVLCSKVEGVPGVILEAATFGIPSLAVNVGGVAEVVKNGETGFLIQGHQVNDFAAKLLEVVRDPAKLALLGAGAQKFVREEFDPAKNVLQFIKLYHQLISKREN